MKRGKNRADTFEFTLNNPLTEEQWDMIADVDLDHTDRIWFHTKHGKEVEFVKARHGKWLDKSFESGPYHLGLMFNEISEATGLPKQTIVRYINKINEVYDHSPGDTIPIEELERMVDHFVAKVRKDR